ncbi:hypothetical protein WAK64_06175 [Bacillus spongiae]|uniref:Uncharacterized protein n=1 Tax=Bacillus spongiae TaxID=2683610 RepID=A0ABU8HBW4_9BACI
MKYFDYDLMTSMNNGSLSEEEIEAAERQWNNNSAIYAKTFSSLIGRLPHEVYTRFKGWGFHDYELEKLAIHHTSLLDTTIDFFLKSDSDRWKLSFFNISTFHFNHLTQDTFAPIFNRTVDSWLAEEFIVVDDHTLSFEVLFLSGANIQLTLKNKNMMLEKL